MKTTKRITALFLTAALLLSFAACRSVEKQEEDPADKETTEAETTANDTTAAEDAADTPAYFHPLTGLGCDTDLGGVRPVSIMVNNIKASLPQQGIAQADILYECLAEGGITRLMAISTEYEKLPQIGSVRSARDYYIDFAESYDCIFFHAGASTYAYDTLANRGTDHVDGVGGPAYLYSGTGTFIRDPERQKKYSSEHTLMIQNGAGIANAVAYYGFRTERSAAYGEAMRFTPWGNTVSAELKAAHIRLEMSNYQKVDYVYDEQTGQYLRYQYDGMQHIDELTGEQLTFTNVIIMLADCGGISGDEKGRIWVQTTGKGSGWYMTGGTYAPITWEKASHDTPISYFYQDGTPVELNRGKSMINVVPSYNENTVVFDDNWNG